MRRTSSKHEAWALFGDENVRVVSRVPSGEAKISSQVRSSLALAQRGSFGVVVLVDDGFDNATMLALSFVSVFRVCWLWSGMLAVCKHTMYLPFYFLACSLVDVIPERLMNLSI